MNNVNIAVGALVQEVDDNSFHAETEIGIVLVNITETSVNGVMFGSVAEAIASVTAD